MQITREFYIPTGAIKVTDKNSDGVAYVYRTANGVPAAVAFHGRASKPDWRFTFRSDEHRVQRIARFFASRKQHLDRVAERRGNKKRMKLEVGHILRTSWGYDQTNVEFFQVTKLIGSTMVEVREIASISDGGFEGTATPRLDAFTGDPIRRRIGASSVRIDSVRRAYIWDGTPARWSATH